MADPTQSAAYGEAQNAAETAYKAAIANINKRRQSTLQQYGYTDQGALDSSNPYGLFQQSTRNYSRAQEDYNTAVDRFAQQYGITLGDSGYSVNDTGDGLLQRLAQDRTKALSGYGDQRARLLRDSGLTGKFDANGNLQGDVSIDPSNTYGGFENLLRQEATDLEGARNDSVNRGLGVGPGLARQQGSKLAFAQEGDRRNFRNQLVDSLTDLGKSQTDTTQQYDRQQSDYNTAIRNQLVDYITQAGDLQYGYGLDQYNLGTQLQGILGGYDQEASNDELAYREALLQALMSQPVDTSGGGSNPSGTNPYTAMPLTAPGIVPGTYGPTAPGPISAIVPGTKLRKGVKPRGI